MKYMVALASTTMACMLLGANFAEHGYGVIERILLLLPVSIAMWFAVGAILGLR